MRRDEAVAAEQSFRLALEKREEYTLARLGLARALTAQKKLDDAAAELREAARRDAANPQPYLLLSQTLFRLGKYEDAKSAKETSQRLRIANLELLNVPQSRPFLPR